MPTLDCEQPFLMHEIQKRDEMLATKEDYLKIRKALKIEFSVNPELPPNFTFDAESGEISGIPAVDMIGFEQKFTVTATNSAGVCQTTLEMKIVGV